MLLLATVTLRASEAIVVWNPNPEPDIAGYVVRYGLASGAYSISTNVGNVTRASVDGLIPGTTYYFVVSAYNTAGLESDPSMEVSVTPPTDPPPTEPPPTEPPPTEPPPTEPPPTEPPPTEPPPTEPPPTEPPPTEPPPTEPPPTEPPPPPTEPPPTEPPAQVTTHTLTLVGDLTPFVRVQPSDRMSGSLGGVLPLTRVYPEGTVVTITAPLRFAGKAFSEWRVGDSVLAHNPSLSVILNASATVTAVYVEEELVAHWALDELSGRDAIDSSPHGHDAKLDKGTVWTEGVHGGGALLFDGKDDLVKTSDDDQLEFVDRPFTLALWVRTAVSRPQALVEKKHNTLSGSFLLALNQASEGALSVYTGESWLDSNARDLADGDWHHLAVVYDGASFGLYCDGNLDRSSESVSTYVATKGELRFGRTDEFAGHWPFAGALDDIRLYRRALSGHEVEALANPRSSLQLHIVRQSQSGPLRLLIFSLDGTPITSDQLARVDLLSSESLNLPPDAWTVVPSRPVLNGGVGEWVQPDLQLQSGRFYMLRERP